MGLFQRRSPRDGKVRAVSGRVAIVIPALNEQDALPHVLGDIQAALEAEVVVVDNRSTDQTAEVARNGGATVLYEPQRGYGAACLRGINYLAEGDAPPDVLVILDGDHADDPSVLPADFVEPILRDEVDLVLSTRREQAEPGSMSAVQLWGNTLQTTLLRARFGLQLTDMGPMRAIRFSTLLELAMEDRTWGWNVEMACKAARNNLRIREVPVSYRNRIGESKISGTMSGVVRAGGKILYAFAKYGR